MSKSKVTNKVTASKASSKKTKPKREVQVVSCPTAFPISTKKSRKRPRDQRNNTIPENKDLSLHHATSKSSSSKRLLDWNETAKEVRAYGATAFIGKEKRDYEDEKYFALTGRHKKKQHVPLPIVRGIKKAAAKRDAKMRREAKEAGIIMPKVRKEKKKDSSTYNNYGPAPSIGFMKNGIFQVSKKKR